MSEGTVIEELSLHFDPVWSWAFVVLVGCGLLAVLLLVPPDRSRLSRRGRMALILLRMTTFLAVVLCMLRPTIVSARKARQHGTVVVLADASESMTVTDGPGERSRWDTMVEALAAARPAARTLVAGGDFDIVMRTFDRDTQVVEPAGNDPFPLGSWTRRGSVDETGIGAAIEDGLRAAAGKQLAGVIVLSDGAQHAYAPRDIPPQTAARKVADVGAPLWSVTFGQQRGGGQARDAAVVNLTASETVYLKNVLEVSGRVRLEGLVGRDVGVVLLAEGRGGVMEEVARTRVRADTESSDHAVRLSWTPTELGERKVTLRVEPQDGEVVIANNELSTFVEVIEGGLKALYLEGALRVEQRFLRRVLAASPDMHIDFEWIDSSRRDRWPVNLSQRLAGDYDVFLIGDLDATALRPEDLRTILTRVGSGAGLGLLGGLHAFEAGGWGSSPLGAAMPFEIDPLSRQPFDGPVRSTLHVEGAVRLVPDRQFGGVSILRLGKTDEETRAAWQAMPPLDGANRLGVLKPTTKTLAASADGSPLLVGRDYGSGRVAAFAADSTWRWAMQGAIDQHRRFWRQFVLWLARQDDAADDRLWLRLAQRRISPGTPLPFDAGLTRPDGTASPGVSLEATLVAPDGTRRPVRLARQGDTFSGAVTDAAEPGDWRLVVQASRPGEPAPQERSARFTVFRQDLELANPRANPLLMRQLAEVTTGGVRLPEELATVFEEIAATPPAIESQEQWSFSPWDTWPMFLLMAGGMATEWLLRKRWGLV